MKRDSQIFDLIAAERSRQMRGIELIASENFVSDQVMEAMGSVLTNKYAEGYPAARYYGGLFALEVVKLAGLAERACKVHQVIALLEEVKALRGGAYLLEYYGCRTLFAVVIRDGEGYALALFVNAKHNELAGQGLPCDVGRFDFYQRHRVVQTFFSYYTVHRLNIAPFRFLDIKVDNIISPI